MVSDERAQLILVGAIAIGIVLIALTTVLNSAVFTENVAGGSSVEVTGDVQEFERESVRNVRSLVIRVNHGDVYQDSVSDRNALNASARDNVSSYSDILAETYADTGSVYVNVSYGGSPTFGDRIVQREDANFSKSSPGVPTWTVVNGPFEPGWFVVVLEVENVSRTTPMFVNLTNASGDVLNVSIRRTASNELAVNSSIGGSHRSNVTCQPQNGRVLLDVLEGVSYSGDCEFNTTAYLDEPYSSLKFENGNSARGKYDIVVNESAPPNTIPNSCGAGASPLRPCEGVAIWTVEFTSHYETGPVSYEKTHNVSVYDA